MSLQDNSGVRTVQDILKAYDLSLLTKNKVALEQQKIGLNKLENEKEEILKSLILNLGNLFESQSDISLWFFDGIPTLENNPAIDWTTSTLKDSHIGDFYYDKQSGLAYKFLFTDDIYSWVEINDSNLSQAMALTNASLSAVDNERKVFWTTPTPEYKCGDWWLKDNLDLYICQISKDSTQQYEESDFIIASKYTDDTLARKTDNELKVVSGSVAIIKATTDSIESTVKDTLDTITDVNTDLQEYKKTVSTDFVQTKDSFEMKFKEQYDSKISDLDTDNGKNSGLLNTIQNYIQFTDEGITIGESGSDTKLVLQKGIIYFNNKETVLENGKLKIANAVVVDELQICDFSWIQETDGTFNLIYVGSDI